MRKAGSEPLFNYNECIEIRELFNTGFTMREIREYIGKGSYSTVHAVVSGTLAYADFDEHAGRHAGYEAPNPQYMPHENYKLTGADVKQIIICREMGMSQPQIAKKMNVSDSRISQICVKHGVTRGGKND